MKKILLVLGTALFFANTNAQNNWTQKADFGGAVRNKATGFSIGNKGYIGTGGDGSDFPKKDFWEYDPATDVWTQKADFGGRARYGATGFSIGNKGYIGTGFGGNYKNDFWEYDPDANIWTQKANFGGTGRNGATGFSIDSKGYIGTGYTAFGYTNDFWEYDTATDTWTQRANFGGEGRTEATGFSIGSKGYIGTGNRPGYYANDFWEYDPATDTWSSKADVGDIPRTGAIGFSIGNKGYIGTGFNGSYKTDFWEYDPTVDTWVKMADFAGTGRYGATGFAVGGNGYISTGLDGSGYRNDLWQYTPCSASAAVITLTSGQETDGQNVCINSPITNITYSIEGETSPGVTGLPDGVNSSFNNGVLTISGSPTISGTFNYTVYATVGCTSNSPSGSITVAPASVGGTVSGSTTVCTSSNIGDVTLTGHTGTITKWQSSTDGTDWMDIDNGGPQQGYYYLEQTTQYRAIVQSGTCPSATSSAATITVTALPTANIIGNTTICPGSSASISFTGTPNTTVTYEVNGGASQTIDLNAGGNATLNTGALTSTTVYSLVSVAYATPLECSNSISGSATVSVAQRANAGLDRTDASTCGLTTITLQANNPSPGTGKWTKVSGKGGTFSNASLFNAHFTGIAGNTYTLRWTTTSVCATASDDVVIKFNRNPTTAHAGPDQAPSCGVTRVTLAANSPSTGTGQWSVVNGTGGQFDKAGNPKTRFRGTAGVTYTLRWTITNAPCSPSTDDVVIAFNACGNTMVASASKIPASNRSLKMQVFPNPAAAVFNLVLQSNSNEEVEIRVLDMYGKMVYQNKGSVTQKYTFGQSLASGMYVVRVIQGKQIQTMKVVKEK